jgi:hypothetical protein
MRRTAIIAASGLLSLILVLTTMQMVCYFLNRIFSTHYRPTNVIWLVNPHK